MINDLPVCTGDSCRYQVADVMNGARDCSDEIHEWFIDL